MEKVRMLPRWTLFALVILAVLFSLVMQVVGAPLTTPPAPAGIVSFEFAGELGRARQIVASWDQRAQLHAALSLGLDYLYLVTYAVAIGTICLRLAAGWQTEQPGLARLGRWLGAGQGLAALLDSVENVALIRLLLGSTSTFWPPLAWICAALKFSLVLLGLAYILVSLLLQFLRRLMATPKAISSS